MSDDLPSGKGAERGPQGLFEPYNMLMPVETAAELLKISVDEPTQSIASGERKKLRLIESPEGYYVEYKL